jgi:hypothetical protein
LGRARDCEDPLSFNPLPELWRDVFHDKETEQRTSLETKDKARANELLVAHNEAARKAQALLAKLSPANFTSPL